jgi:hypothetical protein
MALAKQIWESWCGWVDAFKNIRKNIRKKIPDVFKVK